MNKVFSGIDGLPKGNASDRITEGCLILEGGAFRALYGEGVLDVMMLANINLSTVIGVSAGAMNGINYVAGQIGRSARVNLRYRHDRRYIGAKGLKDNQGIIRFDFLFNELNDSDPLDWERFNDPRRHFVAVATNCNNGEATYFDTTNCQDITKAIQASASMPFVSKMVMIDGIPYLDGGCSDKIPIQWALDRGFKKIIVVRTRPRYYRNEPNTDTMKKAIDVIYGNHKAFAAQLSSMNERYNDVADQLDQLEKQGHIFMVAPSKPIHISRLEGDMEKLGNLYYLGYNDMVDRLNELRAYLKQ